MEEWSRRSGISLHKSLTAQLRDLLKNDEEFQDVGKKQHKTKELQDVGKKLPKAESVPKKVPSFLEQIDPKSKVSDEIPLRNSTIGRTRTTTCKRCVPASMSCKEKTCPKLRCSLSWKLVPSNLLANESSMTSKGGTSMHKKRLKNTEIKKRRPEMLLSRKGISFLLDKWTSSLSPTLKTLMDQYREGQFGMVIPSENFF